LYKRKKEKRKERIREWEKGEGMRAGEWRKGKESNVHASERKREERKKDGGKEECRGKER